MKTSLFIEQGDVQLVLTPENDFERDMLKSLLPEGPVEAHVAKGQFYQCRGGWHMRADAGWAGTHDSFILRVRPRAEQGAGQVPTP